MPDVIYYIYDIYVIYDIYDIYVALTYTICMYVNIGVKRRNADNHLRYPITLFLRAKN